MKNYVLWVCESCGDEWRVVRELAAEHRPARDRDGRVLCEPCRIYAGILVKS